MVTMLISRVSSSEVATNNAIFDAIVVENNATNVAVILTVKVVDILP